MKQKVKDTKSIVDSAHPHPEGAERLSEAQKKAMELGGLMEHVDGPAREELHDQARALDERAKGA